jgi:hypothetical protein
MANKRYSVQELRAGMILAQAVDDDHGRTIMPQGARLTPMHIKRLQKWGLESVLVAEDEAGDPESSSVVAAQEVIESASGEERESMRRIAEEVQQRFRDADDDPVMAELKRLAVRHLVLHGRDVVPDRGD